MTHSFDTTTSLCIMFAEKKITTTLLILRKLAQAMQKCEILRGRAGLSTLLRRPLFCIHLLFCIN